MWYIEIISVLALSNAVTAYLLYKSIKSKTVKYTHDARKVLHDLTRGEVLIRIIPVDANQIFLRSPRDI